MDDRDATVEHLPNRTEGWWCCDEHEEAFWRQATAQLNPTQSGRDETATISEQNPAKRQTESEPHATP